MKRVLALTVLAALLAQGASAQSPQRSIAKKISKTSAKTTQYQSGVTFESDSYVGGPVYEGEVHGGVVHEGVVDGGVVHEGAIHGAPISGVQPPMYYQGWSRSRAGNVWHGSYYNAYSGGPTALVVPPTARRRWEYSSYAPSSHLYPIQGQFSRYNYIYGPSGEIIGMMPTPAYRTHTLEAGVYPVRAPW